MQSQIRSHRLSHAFVMVFAALWLSMLCVRLHASPEDWQSFIRQLVQQQELTTALTIAESRLAERPDDLEARGWRARLLAWTHRWNESEIEYLAVLHSAPHDMDILVGLADLLIWQERSVEALTFLDQATALDGSRNDVQLRRGRLLHALGRRAEAGAAYSRVLSLEALFGGVRDESVVAADLESITKGDGNRSADPAGVPHGDDSFQWDWRWRFSPGPVSGLNGRFYRRFGQAAARWDATDTRQTSFEFFSGGRIQPSIGMNYAIRF